MEREYITGAIYTELHEDLGPNPLYWFPYEMSEEMRMSIGLKTITLLTAEQGVIPKSVIILPFPSMNLKGIIKFLQWKDDKKRGGVGNSAITLVFREVDDIIFYKYIQDLEFAFNEIAKQLVQIETNEPSVEKIEKVILSLIENVTNILEEFRTKELATQATKEFPVGNGESKETVKYQFKVIVCGDPSVGKTSMILRFTDNAFKRTYLPTLGVNVSKTTIRVNNAHVQLVLWDIAGQEKFSTMRTDFYSGSRGVLLVFDLTNLKSFDSVSKWYKDIKENIHRDTEIIGYVIGNKNDLKNERRISVNEIAKLADALDLKFLETSALTGENIDDAFYSIAKSLYLKNK